MMEVEAERLRSLGAEVELADLGMETLKCGTEQRLPPVILATLGRDPAKTTVLMYGHLDVQPAAKSDGWATDPFVLTEKAGKLFGRGSTDDKGPVVGVMNVIETFKDLGFELPINFKFVFEGMEESSSVGLAELMRAQKGLFLKGVDQVCVTDTYWPNTTKPAIQYGLRGVSYFEVAIQCAAQDLHSGLYGGMVHEAMTDLFHVMSHIVDAKGHILVPGIYDDVRATTDDERAIYKDIEFSHAELCGEVGCTTLLHETKEELLMHNWRHPCASIHGVEGAFYEAGHKTVIPRRVVGKFSVRTVPDMTSAKVEQLVIKHVTDLHAQSGSPNTITVDASSGPWFLADHTGANYTAGRKATEKVWGVAPDLVRIGGSIPIAITLEEVTGKSVLLLPMGKSDDMAHSQNEKLDRKNYINGMKVFAAYFEELASINKKSVA